MSVLPPTYEFGPFVVETGRARVLRGGAAVPLPPKAYELLLFFIRHPRRVISKAELMAALWPDTFVEDANLTQHVFTLRKALGTHNDGQPLIETISRHGYCFSAVVHETAAELLPMAMPAPGIPDVAPPPAVVGERKQATVLHCGVANASALAERLGPEGMLGLLRRMAAVAEEEFGRYDGVLRQHEPDCLVALFGARIVHEDDARRALLAAVAFTQRLGSLEMAAAADDDRVLVRIGIHSGPVVVNRVGERGAEISAVGDTVRIADLLQQLAEPGIILISDATRRRAAGFVRVAAADVHAAGVSVFRLLDVQPTRMTHDEQPSRSPFVGRDEEMRLLKTLLGHAAAGRGQAVCIVGEPGMGKSRLLEEFTTAVAAADGMTLLGGRCVSYGERVPYLPLADLVRSFCRVGSWDPPQASGDALERAAHAPTLSPDEAACLRRLIGGDPPAAPSISPEAVKAQTFEALRTLLLRHVPQPLLIAVEDIHWIDQTSEEFLSGLVERLVGARVLLIATHRPGYRPPWMDRSYATQITLGPLSAADCEAVVASIDREGQLPSTAAATILAKAEGNPFFLEEITRGLVEHGPEASVPDTVQGVIMARLDRLPDAAKVVLQTASVFGRELSPALLARVVGRSVEPDLRELSRLEFIFEKHGSEPTFVFKHALTQDVAYDSLLARQRRDLHLKAARALEELYAGRLEEVTATLAHHYARTDLVEDTVRWLLRAADKAARVYANAEAVLHLDLARRRLERLPEGPTRDRLALEVALRHAHSLYFLGQFRDSVTILLPHDARLIRLGDPALTAATAFWLAHMYSRLAERRRAEEYAHRAIAAATLAGDEPTLGKAHGLLALEGHWAGKTTEGLRHGRSAIRLLGRHRDQRWWLGMAHFYMALNHVIVGSYEEALREVRLAHGVGEEIGDPRLQTYAAFTTAWIDAARGRHLDAVAAGRRARELAPDRVSRAYASLFLGLALLEIGDHPAAAEVLEPATAELESFGIRQWHGLASALAGEASRLAGDLDGAARSLARGLAVMTDAGYWYGVGMGEQLAGRLARTRGDDAAAAAAFARAGAIFERIGATHMINRDS